MKRLLATGRAALGVQLPCLALAAFTAMLALPSFAADDVQFPDASSSYLKTGDFIAPERVRRVTPALNKDQVRLALGNPHFSEGLFGVREWDYVFNFYTGKANNDYVTCQYKVQFDKGYRVSATFWKDSDCASYVALPAAAPVVAEISPPVAAKATLPARRRLELASDGLFAFGKSGINDLAAAGREKLDAQISQLSKEGVSLTDLLITGHTDRIGSSAANMALSAARADTVRAYLVKGGVNAKLIRVRARGESSPLVECQGNKVTPLLVACLQSNRRVEIESTAER